MDERVDGYVKSITCLSFDAAVNKQWSTKHQMLQSAMASLATSVRSHLQMDPTLALSWPKLRRLFNQKLTKNWQFVRVCVV